MPGLSQLKKFNSDILALGKEAELRASRGEKTSVIPIPKTIEDTDDSDDFVLGMPEAAEDLSSVEEEESPDDFSDITGIGKASSPEGNAPADSQKAGVPDVADLLNPVDMSGGDTGSGDVPDLSQFMEPPQEPEPEPEPPSIADLSLDDLLSSSGFDDDSTEEEAPAEEETEPAPTGHVSAPQKDEPVDSSSFFTEPDVSADTFNEPETLESASLEDIEPEEPAGTSGDEMSADEFQEENNPAPRDDFDYAGQTLDMNTGLPDEVNETDAGKAVPEPEEPEPVEPFADDFGIDAIPEQEEELPAEGEGRDQESPVEEKFDLPDFDEDAVNEVPSAETEPELGESAGSDMSSSQPEQPAEETVSVEESSPPADSGDLNLPDMGMEGFNPDTFDFNLDDTDLGQGSAEEEVPSGEALPEKFDTSDIAGLDFSIKDTDTKLADDEKSDFELGKGSDFKEENADFEIPGFSDTDTIKEDKNGRIKLPTPDFTGAEEGDKPGKNTLSDSQYKQFLANLADYPLNVRIAVENLLVKNEFTDEAQFEVVEKVLHKTPARQVAAHLEKMLDISIPVPRDFERRTASEYEVYKSSLQYQLRNRIIPGLIFAILALLLVFGLFQAVKNFIYKPLKANKLYKQGYELLQSDEYPQSEMKFNDAVKYELQKKWFYRYARGYRSHKQYQRAEKMYRNILYCFNHDKTAGIEYAQMECDDLENYEKAETVAKREVLDYHINDSDGILLLGDIYLAWGTEKDPLKLEDARKQYSSLVQLYGPTDVYMSRMMRYFIRTDNLREVLKLKERFYPKEKSLGAQDWTELSGYLLEKLYGQLAPADEYLRTHIEDVKEMLVRAVEADPSNPVAYYNLSRYFVQMNNGSSAIQTLEHAIDTFKKAPSLRRRDTYKEIDSYRLLGEQYNKAERILEGAGKIHRWDYVIYRRTRQQRLRGKRADRQTLCGCRGY